VRKSLAKLRIKVSRMIFFADETAVTEPQSDQLPRAAAKARSLKNSCRLRKLQRQRDWWAGRPVGDSMQKWKEERSRGPVERMARRLSRTKTVARALAIVAICAGTSIKRGSAAETPEALTCGKVVLNGEVSAGHEWKMAFGEGWAFRVVPIPKDKTAAGLGGWDLVVDREEPAGFPDSVLVATPPYNLINPREVATSYGLRAQDAIGWNPRRFRFMTNRNAFRQAQ
jgi:hypothetical protein